MNLKKTFASVAAAVMLAVMVMPFSAFADTANSYVVTIRSGNYGTVDAQNAATVNVVNGVANLNGLKIATKDAQRIATSLYCSNLDALGEDGTVTLQYATDGKITNTLSNVTSDQTYVVVYDYLSNLVPYTIQYVDNATGLQIAPSAIAYGSNGSTVKAAAPAAISNYAYVSDTGSIVLDGTSTNNVNTDAGSIGKNVITYRYTLQNNTVTTVNTVTETTENVTVVGAAAGGAAAGAGAGGAGAATTITDNTTPQGTAQSGSTAASSEAAASSSVTIADSETPQGAAPAQSGLSVTSLIAIIGAAVIVLALIFVMIFIHRRNKKAE